MREEVTFMPETKKAAAARAARILEELTSLAGVGRKTANVIRGNIYHEPSIVWTPM